jgi:putative thioredoxin
MNVQSPFIIEVTEESFEQDVIERSRNVPVVVDFWAQWCGPCRQLGPLLERLAEEFAGKFVLVKADTERVPALAGEFGVRSIPAVFAVRDGKVVDAFVGALPESAIRAWLGRILPTPLEMMVAEARGLEATDPKAAEANYRSALELSPHDVPAKVGLARLLLRQGRIDEAQILADELKRRGPLEPEAEKLVAELELRGQAEAVGDLESARAAVAAHPEDLRLKLLLAEALAASGGYEEALEICIDLVERDRSGVGEEARKTMLNIFQLLPEDSELIGEFRRRLAAAIF